MGRRCEIWREQALVLVLAFIVFAFALVQCTGIDGEGKGGPSETDPATGPPLPPGWIGDSGSRHGSSPDGSWHYGWGWGSSGDGSGGGFGFGYGGNGGGGGGGSGGARGFGTGGVPGGYGSVGGGDGGAGGHHSEVRYGDSAGDHGLFGGGVWSKRGLFRGRGTATKDVGGNN